MLPCSSTWFCRALMSCFDLACVFLSVCSVSFSLVSVCWRCDTWRSNSEFILCWMAARTEGILFFCGSTFITSVQFLRALTRLPQGKAFPFFASFCRLKRSTDKEILKGDPVKFGHAIFPCCSPPLPSN